MPKITAKAVINLDRAFFQRLQLIEVLPDFAPSR